jgi:methylenetetrahydrofolate reductase (NADPH)
LRAPENRGHPPIDLFRARLARRDRTVTVEVVTPPPGDEAARARVLALADAVRDDARVAAVALTDRTTSPDGDPLTLAPAVTVRSAKSALVHIAGKGRTAAELEQALRCAAAEGIGNVLLTGGDPWPGGMRVDAVEMLQICRRVTDSMLPVGVLAPPVSRPLEEAWAGAAAKREAGAAAFVAQVSWDMTVRETLAGWQARLGVPILGAAMVLTAGRLAFLTRHGIPGIAVPERLRRRAAEEDAGAALRRLALDLVLLRRLGYAGAHVSGLLSPARLSATLDEADRLDATLGDGWRDVWREAMGIA